jgi:hypothetical protein
MTLHRGKIARAPTISNVRALTRDDLGILKEKRVPISQSANGGVVQRLRDPHHRIARLIAAGLRNDEVCQRSGYSITRVMVLKADPAFQELIAKYREKIDASWVKEQDDFQSLAMANMVKAEAMIAEKLEAAEETGEFLPTRELIAISRDAADRFGYGKRQTNLNINGDFAALLEKAIARSEPAKLKLIESSTIPLATQSPEAPTRPPVTPELQVVSSVGKRRI